MEKAFTYQRKDGGTTDCYGNLTKESNLDLVCDNENKDGIAADVDMRRLWSWEQVCRHLEVNYDAHIEQITAC